MQNRFSDKVQAVRETLGIMFPGCEVTLAKEVGSCTFLFDGKAVQFGERILASHDVDYILMACQAAIGKLKEHPEVTTVEVGAAVPRFVDEHELRRLDRREAGNIEDRQRQA